MAVDRGSGLIRRARLTPANVHDSRAADALVLGDERAVYADKAYASRAALKARGIKDRIMHQPDKHIPSCRAGRGGVILTSGRPRGGGAHLRHAQARLRLLARALLLAPSQCRRTATQVLRFQPAPRCRSCLLA